MHTTGALTHWLNTAPLSGRLARPLQAPHAPTHKRYRGPAQAAQHARHGQGLPRRKHQQPSPLPASAPHLRRGGDGVPRAVLQQQVHFDSLQRRHAAAADHGGHSAAEQQLQVAAMAEQEAEEEEEAQAREGA